MIMYSVYIRTVFKSSVYRSKYIPVLDSSGNLTFTLASSDDSDKTEHYIPAHALQYFAYQLYENAEKHNKFVGEYIR